MSAIEKKRKVLSGEIRKLKKYKQALKQYERARRIWMRRLRLYKMKEMQKMQAMERCKRAASRRETAKLNRTLRRRRKK